MQIGFACHERLWEGCIVRKRQVARRQERWSAQELGRRLGVPNLPPFPLPDLARAPLFSAPPPREARAYSPSLHPSRGSSGRATPAEDPDEPQLPSDINVEEARCAPSCSTKLASCIPRRAQHAVHVIPCWLCGATYYDGRHMASAVHL